MIRSRALPAPAAALAAALLAAALLPSSLTGCARRAANSNALWEIVHGQCVPDQQARGDPAPCAEVDLRDGVERGYAVLKDRRGQTQFLLIPTARVTGIESPALLGPDAPNYFAAAWQARKYVDERAGRRLPRESISLAINSMFARSQNQLHIHIDCIRADVRDALRQYAAQIGKRWAPFAPPLAGQHYLAMRISGRLLGQVNPFKLLAEGVPGARGDMGRHTLVVTGTISATGEPGFIILDNHADRAAGDWGGGEALQDHACALARAGSIKEQSR